MTFRRSATAWLLIKHSMTGNVNGNSHGLVRRSCFSACLTVCVIQLLGLISFDVTWKRICLSDTCVSFSALAVFSRNALYKSTFYLLTYLAHRPYNSVRTNVLHCDGVTIKHLRFSTSLHANNLQGYNRKFNVTNPYLFFSIYQLTTKINYQKLSASLHCSEITNTVLSQQ